MDVVSNQLCQTRLSRFIINGFWLFGFLLLPYLCTAQNEDHPNVVLIITDDQGYGDLGFHGNPHIKTPELDAFAEESIRFTNFYVSPVCAPTRSSLMTGRYSLRTGIRDTYNGGAIMATGEITIAEMLKQADYATGIFGKWHLGDNHPSRPIDQGFDESVVHLSGGMGQVGDITSYFKKDSSYFDPVLWHNGLREAYQGYCSDIFTNEALKFIEENKNGPFFCYLSFNAPHTPLQVPQQYYQGYKSVDPSSGFDPDQGPFYPMSEKDMEDARRVYAMVTNIDDNIARLMESLEDLNLTNNTIVIFMTDNGPQQQRYLSGLRGLKGRVYQGGVKVPFFIRYPSLMLGSKEVNTAAAHIDILPSLAQLCNVPIPKDRPIDGKSFIPLIEGKSGKWEDRPLFFNWTRRYPELYNNMALLQGNFKLVGNCDYDSDISEFELYDLERDPYEQQNIISINKNEAAGLKHVLDSIYWDLIISPNLLNPPLIIIGSENENPVILNRNDADGQRGIWNQEEIFGKWNARINKGTYDIRFKFINPVPANGRMLLEAGPVIHQITNDKETDIIEMRGVVLPEMNCEFIPFYSTGSRRLFPFWVELLKI